jgi:ureidoglycolate hydrolase
MVRDRLREEGVGEVRVLTVEVGLIVVISAGVFSSSPFVPLQMQDHRFSCTLTKGERGTQTKDKHNTYSHLRAFGCKPLQHIIRRTGVQHKNLPKDGTAFLNNSVTELPA